jgi:hypothetical protein
MTMDFADVKPSLLNWTVVGLMAVTFISFWKFVFSMWGQGVPFIDSLAKLVASI